MNKLTKYINNVDKAYDVRIYLSILAIIALVISLIWASSLKLNLLHLEILDEHILKDENRYNFFFSNDFN